MIKKSALSVSIVKSCFFTFALILSCFCLTCYAQTSTPIPAVPTDANTNQATDLASRPSADLTNNPPSPTEATAEQDYLSSKEFILAILLTLVSLIALSMQFFLLKNLRRLKAEDALRPFGVILIIMGTLFVIVAGFSSVQIAPAMGLFGTIAGYLLGRVEKREDEKKEKEDEKNV